MGWHANANVLVTTEIPRHVPNATAKTAIATSYYDAMSIRNLLESYNNQCDFLESGQKREQKYRFIFPASIALHSALVKRNWNYERSIRLHKNVATQRI